MNLNRTRTRRSTYLKQFKGSRAPSFSPVITRHQQGDAITTLTYNATANKAQVLGGRKAPEVITTAKPAYKKRA